ncbi:MAG TPA: DNA gyrase subunit A [Bacteroidales bacterium]|jgi:DNA gyrase subunit A|nr:DNA gyrase subunit A [Bacteroidales bacterium]
MAEGEKIIQINIEEEMKSAYIDYSMSVIVSRALPDVRDGLKPVHRRVLFGMQDLGVLSNRPYKKSARIVGEVLGKYHPHGDSSVYEAMVRMAQNWSLRYPLVEGQGNFGSMDGDNPAAMRYTEARLRKIAEEMLADIEKDTVDFQLNFDDTLQEPTVLPSKIPNLLVNGASGIAVGMATNMPPHNLTEVCKAIIAYIDNNDITIEQLMTYVKGPDFPTGGIIYGYQGIKEAFETGRGRIVMRARTEIEVTPSGREVIVIKEVPYQVNKAEMIRKIAELINEKKIEGISYINDETDRKGIRVVIICKKEAQSSVVLNNLYKHTQLQTTFNVNNIALVHGRPKLLSLKLSIKYFVEHRHEVVIRRTKFELEESEKKAHILEGLLIALDHIDEVIALIRASKTPDEAREGLISSFALTEVQARAILEMRLQRLTGLEREKIRQEYEELQKTIAWLRQLLADESLRMKVIKDELQSLIDQYGDERLTTIIPDEGEFNPEDFYADDDMIITVSHLGYIKRTPLSEFRTQARGGKGSKGSETRDEDYLEHMYHATMHNTMLFFTENGRCFWLKVYEIPEGTRISKGRAIQNMLSIDPNDKVTAFINLKSIEDQEYISNNYIVLCTRKGIIKKTSLEAYSRPRQNGINAINIREGDSLIEAQLTNGNNEIIIAVKSGKAIRFNEKTVRPMGRTASGVTGIRFAHPGDEVIGMICIDDPSKSVLVVSENGYGKRTELDDYRITNRGGKGVKTINVTEKTGDLIAIKSVTDKDDIMIINKSGLTIRLAVCNLRLMGRATQGVKLINIKSGDSIAAVTDVVGSGEDNNEEKELRDTVETDN